MDIQKTPPILDMVEGSIKNRIVDGNREPSVIIMHPKTWEQLVSEMIWLLEYNAREMMSDIKYKGIPV